MRSHSPASFSEKGARHLDPALAYITYTRPCGSERDRFLREPRSGPRIIIIMIILAEVAIFIPINILVRLGDGGR